MTENFVPIMSTVSSAQPQSLVGNEDSNRLLQDIYPSTNKNTISEESSNTNWWHYPTFAVGSYSQITNNIKYPNNPDIGTCSPSSMCGALYHEKSTGTNYITPLPPVSGNGTRVGYFMATTP